MQPISYVWTLDYHAAFLERDYGKLTAQVAKVSAAIQQRKAELLQNSAASSDELEAIAKALRVLGILRDIARKHS